MGSIDGGIPVSGFICPTTQDDLYSTHDSRYGLGGWREVDNIIDRDNISIDRRRIGMVVYVTDIKKHFILRAGITNSNWSILYSYPNASIVSVGDSQSQLGFDTVYKGGDSSNYGGISASLLGTEWNAKTETSGILLYRANDKSFQWTINGDTSGPWTPITRAGRYTFNSGTSFKGVTINIRSFLSLPTSDKSITVNLSGQLQTRVNQSGNPTALGHVFGYFGLPYNVLGASGARSNELVEYLDWLDDNIPDQSVVIVRIGTNDIGAGTVATNTIIANAYQAFDSLRDKGHKLVICGVAARWANSLVGTPLTQAQYTQLHDVNKAYKQYCELNYIDCEYIDTYSVSVDPDYLDARPAAGAIVDYVHDGYQSAIEVANLMIAAISRWIKPQSSTCIGDPSILNTTTAWLQGTAGTNGTNSSGIVPTGWNIKSDSAEVTVVNSVSTNLVGQNYKTLTSVITSNASVARKVTMTLSTIPDLSMYIGGKAFFETSISMSYTNNLAPVINPYIYVNLNPSPGIRTDYYITRSDEPSRRISAFVEIPTTATTMVPVIEVQLPVGSTQVTVNINYFLIKNSI